jgi:beta-lactam-binding protein with PASTA domain
LRDAHLSPRLVAVPVYSESVPEGKIASVDPPVGHHTGRGAAVRLKVSLGPERYSVPTVTGLRLVDAVAALRVAHLHPGTPSNAYSDSVPAGAVISITPTAGTEAKPQAPVAIVASRGPAPVTAPKLTGMTAGTATTALQKLGLKVTVSNDFSETVPIGQVIGVIPATGLHRTQKVSLSVSKGPRLVQIPNDIERDFSPGYAKQYLSSLGLNVVTRSFPGLDSSIAKVLPGPGSLVRVGSQVTILLY